MSQEVKIQVMDWAGGDIVCLDSLTVTTNAQLKSQNNKTVKNHLINVMRGQEEAVASAWQLYQVNPPGVQYNDKVDSINNSRIGQRIS